MSTEAYLVLAVLLLAVGALGLLLHRNAITAFMNAELMLNVANLVFVTSARQCGKLDGQVASSLAMVVAAAEVVVGLAIIAAVYRVRRSVSVDDANLLKF